MNKHDADLRKLSMDWVDAFTWLCEADELAEREPGLSSWRWTLMRRRRSQSEQRTIIGKGRGAIQDVPR